MAGSVDNDSFDKLYREHVDTVYRAAHYYSDDRHAADEITQNVFLKLYVNREHINPQAVGDWLLTTTRRTALNHKRDRWYEIPCDNLQEESFFVCGPEDDFMIDLHNRECRELLKEIFDDLHRVNERWYDAIMITYLLQKPQKEVSQIMGMSLECLHSTLYRARKWVQKKYRERYERICVL